MKKHAFPLRVSHIMFLLLLCFTACKKTDQHANLSSGVDILSFSLDPSTTQTTINPGNTIQVRFADSILTGGNLTASFVLSSGAHASVNNVPQVSGVTKNNFTGPVTYTVISGSNLSQKLWTVHSTNNDHTSGWGLGNFLSTNVAEDQQEEWYLDQANTGTYSTQNCGPTSVTMAIKWADPSFTRTPLDARNAYESSGGWWYTNDIDQYLTDNSVPHAIIPLENDAVVTSQILMHQINNKQIIILCIDMNQMRAATNASFHVDKFYGTSPNWGHFFVVKGYQVVDGEIYFQIYDPFSFGLLNADDGFLKGRNRFYRYEDVASASRTWWNYAIVIAKKGNTVDVNTLRKAVDPTTIRHAHSN